MLQYLSTKYRVADMDKFIFTDLHFGKFRYIGPCSVPELDHQRRELRKMSGLTRCRGAIWQPSRWLGWS